MASKAKRCLGRDKIEKYNRYMNKCINNFLFIYIVVNAEILCVIG